MSAVTEATKIAVQVQNGTIPNTMVFAVSTAMLIGALIVLGVGFAGPEVLHSAAHDLRHGLAFPCH